MIDPIDLDEEATFLLGLGDLLADPGLREAARTDARTRKVLTDLADRLRELRALLEVELAESDGDVARRLLAAPEARA